MINPKLFREKAAEITKALITRGLDKKLIDECFSKEKEYRQALQAVEQLRAKQKSMSKGKPTSGKISQLKDLSNEVKKLEKDAELVKEKFLEVAKIIPNIPDESVPVGKNETENKEIRKWGEIQKNNFKAKAHFEIGVEKNLLNFEQATKLSGARFVVYHGLGAKLERALINFMLDVQTGEHQYQEVLPPFMVNEKTMYGTGQLPKFKQELYICSDDLYLIPTAEVPLTNLHQDEIIDGEKLPLRYAAHTPCFRREAGSYGKDTRGIIRHHQFNKVEIVQFTTPESSSVQLEELTSHAEKILQLLKLPYRVIELCTGDLGFASAKTYDLEVWFPSEGRYREISSCSNFKDFQARRAGIRFKKSPKEKPEYVHTLNGSGLAVGRTFAAIIENFQTKKGEIIIPEVLHSYMGGVTKIS